MMDWLSAVHISHDTAYDYTKKQQYSQDMKLVIIPDILQLLFF